MERLEFLRGAQADMLTWKCGICVDAPLILTKLQGDRYKFTCESCKNSVELEMIWLSHDYYQWPEDFESESEVLEKLAADQNLGDNAKYPCPGEVE